MRNPPSLIPQGLYAFPLHAETSSDGRTYFQTCPGMLLRDYFASVAVPDAMRAVAAGQIVLEPGETPQDAVSRVAYDVADAMLKRRKVTP